MILQQHHQKDHQPWLDILIKRVVILTMVGFLEVEILSPSPNEVSSVDRIDFSNDTAGVT